MHITSRSLRSSAGKATSLVVPLREVSAAAAAAAGGDAEETNSVWVSFKKRLTKEST